MILIKLKEYVDREREVPLGRLAYHFQMPEDLIANMMEHWVQKGVIRKQTSQCGQLGSSLCGGCSSNCHTIAMPQNTQKTIIYQAIQQ